MTKPLVARIIFVSVLMLIVTLAIFEWELRRGSSLETARTAAVSVLVVAEIVYLFHARHFTKSALSRETFSGNRVALLVIAILAALQLLFVYFTGMQAVFDTRALDLQSWLVILTLASMTFLAVEAEKAVWRRRGVRRF